MNAGDGSWLLVCVSTGSEASLRVYVWRQLRKLGAVYVQSSVCLLPAVESVVKAVRRLEARVNSTGGSARVVRIRFDEPGEEAAIVAEQRAERDVEYGEVLDRVPDLLNELDCETNRGRATYAEVEESEADLERFDRWLALIGARDYFGAAGASAAREAVQRCRDALAQFEAAALAADTEVVPRMNRLPGIAQDRVAGRRGR